MFGLFKKFFRDEGGTASIEFVMIFPVFFGFFLMTYEAGVYSSRLVMLEHGVDVTVRAIRIGTLSSPDRDNMRAEICANASILPDCIQQLEIELIQQDMKTPWVALDPTIDCVNRGDLAAVPTATIDNVASNELAFLRACIRIDPFLPSSNLGQAFVAASSGDASAAGSYALVATSAFVLEPTGD